MRWTLRADPDSTIVTQLTQELEVTPLVAKLLAQRRVCNYQDAKHYFRPALEDLHDPFAMKDMSKALERILKAISSKENILIYGDYDVDGTTAVSLLYSFLSSFYDAVATYIPDRYSEGYGISLQGIDFAANNDITLIIALDCGVKAIKQVAYAKEKGIDFIICDHHRPGTILPEAVAILNPKQDDCTYPYKELCGCGIGFKLVQALGTTMEMTIQDLLQYLDLVVTAIGADIVPITGENRVLAYFGLQVLNTTPRPGFETLIKNIHKTKLNISDVVFIIAPRINAAGRMQHGSYAVALLCAKSLEEAEQTAKQIEVWNTDRKSLDQKITKEALQQILDNGETERSTTVVYSDFWHKGVIGIVASRLIENYYRPTLVFTKSGDKLAASARSVRGFDIYAALQACSGLLEQFGGHKYAAGLTLSASNYAPFKEQFESVVAERIEAELLQPEILIDSEITLKEITPKLLRILNQFAPFGPGNYRPVFMAENLVNCGATRTVGKNEEHLKLTICQNGSQPINAIGFNLSDKLPLVANGAPFSAVFSIEENVWQNRVEKQLKIKDIR